MDTGKTRELFAPLIQRPILTDQLLQRPPFKFLHDIVRETLQQTGYPDGLFTPYELDAAKAGSSRENKVAFLQKLIDVLNVDGHLDNVNPAKIVAGKEAEMTNLLLRSLASEATVFLQEKKKLSKKSPSSTSKSKSSSSKRDEDGSNNKEKTTTSKKTTKPLDPSRKAIKETTEVKKSSSRSKSKEKESVTVSIKDKSKAAKEDIRSSTTTAKDKERKKKRSDSTSRSKTAVNNREAAEVEQQPSPAAAYIIPLTPQQQDQLPIGYGNTSLPDSRRTPPDRESSGGTSKGGDDSGIADETGAESERHDLFTVGEPSKNSTPDFIEVHASSSPLLPHPIRPGTAIGRPQTAVGRPGTALARPAPPKPKKNIIGTNVNAENEEQQQQQTAAKPQIQLILENKEEQKAEENFLVEEDDDQLFIGIGTTEGANISKLQEGEEHGVLVNKIIENTRELEKEQKQSGEFVEPGDTFDLHEHRRIFAEVDSAQKSLQKATQNVQPLVRIMEFVVDDFDSMLRELVEYRKQSALFERQLNERAADESSQTAKLGGELRALDDDMTHIRNQVASMKASIMRNESKITELLASNSH